MTYFRQKHKNGIFILSLANADRSIDVGTIKADTVDAYEAGTVLVNITDGGADDGKFIRASDATTAQAEAATRAVINRDRTYADVDTSVVVVERDAEVKASLTDIDSLATDVKAAVVALTKAAGIVLR